MFRRLARRASLRIAGKRARDNQPPFTAGWPITSPRFMAAPTHGRNHRVSVGRPWEVPNGMPMARRPAGGIPDAAAVGTQV